MPDNNVKFVGHWEKIPVKDIIVDKTEITLNPNDTDKITATVKPDDATNQDVTFESSNEDVVKVDENGNITDDTRIRGALPTLKKVLADGGASHPVCLRHRNGHLALGRAVHPHGKRLWRLYLSRSDGRYSRHS